MECSVGDTITIDTGSSTETRKIASLGDGTPAITRRCGNPSEGPVITVPVGSTNVPVEAYPALLLAEDCTWPWRLLSRRCKYRNSMR